MCYSLQNRDNSIKKQTLYTAVIRRNEDISVQQC